MGGEGADEVRGFAVSDDFEGVESFSVDRFDDVSVLELDLWDLLLVEELPQFAHILGDVIDFLLDEFLIFSFIEFLVVGEGEFAVGFHEGIEAVDGDGGGILWGK